MVPHFATRPTAITPVRIPHTLTSIRPAAHYTASLEVASVRFRFNPSQAAANDALVEGVKIVAYGVAGYFLLYGLAEVIRAFNETPPAKPRGR